PSNGGSDGESKAFEKTRDRLLRNPSDGAAWIDYGNLLWGSGKPGLARIAYDRALQINPKSPAALNNGAVVRLSQINGEEDWQVAAEALTHFQQSVKLDEFFVPAKINRALLLNYYRLFARAKPLFEQALTRSSLSDAQEGLAIALQGMGDGTGAAAAFEKAV